jgi:hypothetical protein
MSLAVITASTIRSFVRFSAIKFAGIRAVGMYATHLAGRVENRPNCLYLPSVNRRPSGGRDLFMPAWLAECFARLILASRFIDKSYSVIERARSALILAFAPEAVVTRFNDLAYSRDVSYNPDSPAFRRGLFAWEEMAIATYFPRPPARVLIGGAGGGREVLAMVEKGYEVTAFEPSAALAAAMSCRFAERLTIEVYRARYEDMPHLFPARPDGPSTTLEAGPGFGAAILGWGSYSHVTTEAQRIRTLSSFARYVRGPILVSFFREPHDKEAHTGRFRRKWLRRDSSDFFSVYFGFAHNVSIAELEAAAIQAGLKIVHLDMGGRADVLSPHAVLVPVDLPYQGDLPRVAAKA